MKIECILRREGGSKIELCGTEYHFAPLDDGAHVADVENEAHQDRFLSISEAYRLYRGASEVSTAPAASGLQQAALLGSSVHAASYEINGKTYSLGDVVALAAASFDVADWNELEDDTRHELIDEQLDKLAADTNGDGNVDEGEELAALRAEYEAKFGKKPHSAMKAETLKAKLAE